MVEPGFRTQPLDHGSVLSALPPLVAAMGIAGVAPGGNRHNTTSLKWQEFMALENTVELSSEEVKAQLA